MPPGDNITFHLAKLRLFSCRGDNDRVLSTLALWGLMARGGFPTLKSLDMEFGRWRWGPELGPTMMAAFEGVADTLKELTLVNWGFEKAVDGAEANVVLQNLGEGITKLCRLETLQLYFRGQAVTYHRIAQGMAKGACPALDTLCPFPSSRAPRGWDVCPASSCPACESWRWASSKVSPTGPSHWPWHVPWQASVTRGG
jgi:hypothetical protein